MKRITLKAYRTLRSNAVGFVVAVVCTVVVLITSLQAGVKEDTVAAGTDAPVAAPRKGGAELWSENCVRCHNLRSPSSYSGTQWDVIMLHMRVRANLTPEEHKAILEFLKSAH
jgi:mono/diheme cytochrome c family protein